MALYYDGDLEIHFDCYWREPFDGGQTAAQAFYAEYPEHQGA